MTDKMTEQEKLQHAYNALRLVRMNLNRSGYMNLPRDMLVDNTRTALGIIDAVIGVLEEDEE